MKKINVLIILTALTISVMVSCKDKSENTPEIDTMHAQERPNHPLPKDGHPPRDGHPSRDGHPPKNREDREGRPPRGGSPEQTKTIDEIGGYKIGEIATDFSLKNVDGSMVSLSSTKNAKGYIVTFTCNECPFAKLYEDRLIELHNNYASKGYSVIAINSNNPENEKENYEAMQTRAKEKVFPFAYVVDDVEQKLYKKYGAVRTPHVFLLDSERKVQYIGTIDDNARSAKDVKIKYLENAIEALKSGNKPNPNLTKAIGCPIKA